MQSVILWDRWFNERTMVIISEYDVIATGDSEFSCRSYEMPTCPCCGETLVYRDHRRRIVRTYNGRTSHIQLRRLKCLVCRRMHLELPDFLVPRKHYVTEVIENVIDGVSDSEDESTDDFPCEQTMQRWINWIRFNIPQMDGWLRSVGNRILGFGDALLSSTESLVGVLRKSGTRWLPVCTRAIYNTGGVFLSEPPSKLCTCFV